MVGEPAEMGRRQRGRVLSGARRIGRQDAVQGSGIWGVRTSPVWLREGKAGTRWGGPPVLGFVLEAAGNPRSCKRGEKPLAATWGAAWGRLKASEDPRQETLKLS